MNYFASRGHLNATELTGQGLLFSSFQFNSDEMKINETRSDRIKSDQMSDVM